MFFMTLAASERSEKKNLKIYIPFMSCSGTLIYIHKKKNGEWNKWFFLYILALH